MVRIRKANYFDKFKLKKKISFLSSDVINQYTKVFMTFPLNVIHDLLPLRWKFSPESYVIKNEKDILGMVTVAPKAGNPYKLVISRLFLEQDYFNVGKQLIEFIISRYGAKGANAFVATIDADLSELLHLLSDGCGFRQCSSEQLWKMNGIKFSKPQGTFFRPFKNSDSEAVAELFNESIIQHFKYSISRTKSEYYEPFFKGLLSIAKFKYVVEDNVSQNIKAYFSITTTDNVNYVIDVTTSPWYECSWADVLSFAYLQISRRQKRFNLFVKLKKYTMTAESFEQYLVEHGFECVQNQIVLVKDFYKLLKNEQPSQRILLFNEVSEKPVFKV